MEKKSKNNWTEEKFGNLTDEEIIIVNDVIQLIKKPHGKEAVKNIISEHKQG